MFTPGITLYCIIYRCLNGNFFSLKQKRNNRPAIFMNENVGFCASFTGICIYRVCVCVASKIYLIYLSYIYRTIQKKINIIIFKQRGMV